ncbi:MAG TPA: polysaccharide biosynthesis/export family protein [Thermodesulfovibrionales bacterium]|nr:polysaccharide biosynthesis/export family protein [Thermodesulfovibrionales bacterium]
MKNVSIVAAVLALFSSFLIGCGGGSQPVHVQSPDSEVKDEGKSARMNDLLLKAAMARPADKDADYIIGADDVLDIDVYQAEELHKTVRVSSQGYIGILLIGQIKAKGLTPLQLEQEISKRLEKYMQEPRVSVTIKEYRAQKISVIGAVSTGGVFSVTGQKYLVDMLIMAGGIGAGASEICLVLRPSDSEMAGEKKTETLAINLIDLLEKGDFSLNIPVFTGDIINVIRNGIVFVDGPVNRPGTFSYKMRMTLREAIIFAGGLRFEADPSDVKILRDKGDGTREVIGVNYEDITKGKSNDFPIKENDIIIMGKNGFKNFLVTVSGMLSGGLNTAGGFTVNPAGPIAK